MYKQYVRVKNVRRKQYYVIERRCDTFRHFRFRPITSCLLRNRRRGKGVYSKRFGRGHHGFDTAAVTQTDPPEGSTDRVPEAEPLTPIFLRFPYRCCMLCDVMHRDNKLSPRGRQDDGSSTRGGSTSVRGQVRSPHVAKLQAASVPIAYGSCAPRAMGHTDGQTAGP